MNIKFLVLSILLSFSIPQLNAELFTMGPKAQLKGVIMATDALDLHSYVLHFNGQQTRSNKDGFYTFFPESSEKLTSMSLLICRNFVPKYGKANSIKELISHPNRYRYFVLTKNSAYPHLANPEKPNKRLKPEEGFWIIREEKLTDTTSIPAHCLTILVDPNSLKGIENWPIRLEANTIPIPRIHLKNKKEMIQDKPSRAQKKGYIREASFWSDSNALESSAFHKKLNSAERNSEQGKTKHKTSCVFIE